MWIRDSWFLLSFASKCPPIQTISNGTPVLILSPCIFRDDYDYIVFNLSSSPSVDNDYKYISPPSLSPSFNNYDCNYKLSPVIRKLVAKCGETLSNNCGKEIRNDLLGIGHVSGNYCEKLVKMGWIFHKVMARLAVSTMDNKKEAD